MYVVLVHYLDSLDEAEVGVFSAVVQHCFSRDHAKEEEVPGQRQEVDEGFPASPTNSS